MDELKMCFEDIRNKISLRSNWNNITTTNSYAYALGLDVSENDITRHAYCLGEIGKNLYNLKSEDLDKLSYKQRLFMDLEALNIKYQKVNEKEYSPCSIDEDGYLTWIIAFYVAYGDYSSDFYFLRKNNDGIWYRKPSYGRYITCLDDNNKIITDLNTMFKYEMYDEYEYQQEGIYRLRLKR